MTGRHLTVWMIDLLATTPSYDASLVAALHRQNVAVHLKASYFRHDPSIFARYRVDDLRELPIDIVGRLEIRNDEMRRVFRGIECFLNVVALVTSAAVHRPDVVHLQWPPMLGFGAIDVGIIRTLQRVGIVTAYTVHNVRPHERRRSNHRRFQRIYQACDILLCHTEESRVQLINDFGVPPRRIAVVGMGPLKPHVAQFRATRLPSLEPGFVLAPGTIKPYKGTALLIQAWSKVKSRVPEATLVIAGQGPKRVVQSISEQIARSPVSASIRLITGYLTDDELATLHNLARVVVFPYKSITDSAAFHTALPFFKPMVVSRIGSFAEILKHDLNALLVQPGNSNELADAIARVLTDNQLVERFTKGVRHLMDDRPAWDTIAASTIEAYQRGLSIAHRP